MVEMKVAGLAIDATSKSPIILLMDPSRRRQVPIGIDHTQAHNIVAGIKKASDRNPLSHDLMIAILKAGGLYLEKVIIHSIEESVFQAVLRVKKEVSQKEEAQKQKTIEIEARPSDAIAIAVRSKCSIWMLEKVVAEASIPVDANADEEDQNEFRTFLDKLSPAALVRHLNKENSD